MPVIAKQVMNDLHHVTVRAASASNAGLSLSVAMASTALARSQFLHATDVQP